MSHGMPAVFAVDACRTPIGKIKGALAGVRPDHLTAEVLQALLRRNDWLDPASVDDVYWGAANQAGEDNRNVARMGVLLAGLPVEVPGATVNRLCGSGMEAIASAARAIAAGELDICIAGGTESMTRAPFVLPRAEARSRARPAGRHPAGLAAGQPEDGRAVPARQPGRDGRERGRPVRRRPGRQDEFALASHRKAAAAASAGRFAAEIVPVHHRRRRGQRRRGHQARADPRGAGRQAARVPQERHRHRRQLLAAERRRGRPAADVRAGRRRGRAPSRWPGTSAPPRPGCTPTTWASVPCPP